MSVQYQRKGGDHNRAHVFMLIKWAQAGIEKVKDAPRRIERARSTFKSVGGEMKDLYFTFGKYDMVVIAEVPATRQWEKRRSLPQALER